MPYDLDELDAEVSNSKVTTPSYDLDKMDQDLEYHVSDLQKDKEFSPEGHVAQYSKDDPRYSQALNLAVRVQKQRDAVNADKSTIERVKEMHPIDTTIGAIKDTALMMGKFIAGAPIAGYKVAETTAQSVASRIADKVGADQVADSLAKDALTSKAEAIIGTQKGMVNGRAMAGPVVRTAIHPLLYGNAGFQDMGLAGVMGRMVNKQPDISPSEIKAANEKSNEDRFRDEIEQRADVLRDKMRLDQGVPLDKGIVASVAKASEGGVNPSEAFGPDALRSAGAQPISKFQTDSIGEFTNPGMVVVAAAPGLPGAAKAGAAATAAGSLVAKAPWAIIKGSAKLAGKGLEAMEASEVMAPLLKTKIGKAAAHTVGGAAGVGGVGGLAYGAYANPFAAGTVLGSGISSWLGDIALQQAKERLSGVPSKLSQAVAEGRATGNLALGSEAKLLAGNAVNTGAAGAAGMMPLTAMNAYDSGNPDDLISGSVSGGMFGGVLGLMQSNRPMMIEAIRPMLNREGASSIDTSSTWGKKSAEYLDTLPQDQKDATLETMGALNRIPGQSKDGDSNVTKIIPLNAADYAEAVKAHTDEAAEGGGRGFFYDKNGSIFINGDAPAHAQPGEMQHTIGHEGGHAAMNILAAMGDRGGPLMDGLMKSAKEGLMNGDKPTPEFQKFIDSYNNAFDPSGKTKTLDSSDPRALEEFIAEQAGQIISAEGPGNLVLPKTLTDKLSDSVGGFVSSMLGIKPGKVGTPTKFDRTEVAGLTSVLRNTLSDIAQSKYRDGNVDMSMGDKSTEVQPLSKFPKSIAEPEATTPAAATEPAPVPPTIEDRMDAAGIEPSTVDAARDYHIGNPSEIQPVRANTKKGIAGKTREQVIAEKESEWDDMFTDLLDHAESVGASLPNDPAQLHQMAIEHALGADLGPSSIDRRSGLPRRVSPEPAAPPVEPVESAPDEAPKIAGGEVISPKAAPEPSAPVDTTEPAEQPQDETPKPKAPAQEAVAPASEDQVKAAMSSAEESTKSDPAFARKKKESTRQDAIKTARVAAVLDAATNHGVAVGDEGLLQKRGEKVPYYSGRIDTSIPAHRILLDELGIPKDTESTIGNISNSLGKLVFVDYGSAPKETIGNESTADATGKQRGKELAQSTATKRKEGGETFEQGKAFVPVSFQVFPGKKSVTVKGFSPDKLLSNITKLFDHAQEQGIDIGYRGVNDPQIVNDIAGYATNHANGWQGDGAAPIKDVDVAPTPGYEPHLISVDRFDILNAAFQGARPVSPGEKGAETQALAEANDRPVDPDTGDTNPFRAMVDKSGRFKSTNEKGESRTGSKEMLEEVYENLDPGLIRGIREDRNDNDASVRPTEFSGDLRDMMAGGRPKQGYVNAAFMPNEAPVATKEGFIADESGNPKVFYHGSIGGEVPEKFNKRDISYFTPDKSIAKEYAGNGKVGAFNIKMENPLTMNSPSDILDALPKNLRDRHKNIEYSWEALRDKSLPDLYEDSDVIEALQDAGYDGVIIGDDLITRNDRLESHGVPSYAVFDSESIQPVKQGGPLAAFMPNEKGGLSSMKPVSSKGEKETAIKTSIRKADRGIPFSDPRGSAEDYLGIANSILGGGERAGGSTEGQGAAKTLEAKMRDNGRVLDSLPANLDPSSVNNKGGMEHDVFHDSKSGRWIKIPKAGGPYGDYGIQPEIIDGKLAYTNATLPQYIQRMSDQNASFGTDNTLHGFVKQGESIRPIISQKNLVDGMDSISDHDLKTAMEKDGFKALDADERDFYRESDNTLVVDLHAANAVADKNGKVIPFDVVVNRPDSAMKKSLIEMTNRDHASEAKAAKKKQDSFEAWLNSIR